MMGSNQVRGYQSPYLASQRNQLHQLQRSRYPDQVEDQIRKVTIAYIKTILLHSLQEEEEEAITEVDIQGEADHRCRATVRGVQHEVGLVHSSA